MCCLFKICVIILLFFAFEVFLFYFSFSFQFFSCYFYFQFFYYYFSLFLMFIFLLGLTFLYDFFLIWFTDLMILEVTLGDSIYYYYCFLLKRQPCKTTHRRCSVKNDILKNLANFTLNDLCWSLFLIMLKAFRPATSLKRDSITSISL